MLKIEGGNRRKDAEDESVHVIRHKVLIEGQSVRRVAREMGLSRVTVKKYLRESEPRRKESEARAKPVSDQMDRSSRKSWSRGRGERRPSSV